jgi:hypothetical protein
MPFEVLKISTIAFKLIIKSITVLHSVFKSVFKLEIHPLILLLKPRMTPNEIQGLNCLFIYHFLEERLQTGVKLSQKYLPTLLAYLTTRSDNLSIIGQ